MVFEIGQKKCTVQKVLPAGLFDYCIFSVKKSKIMFFLFSKRFFSEINP